MTSLSCLTLYRPRQKATVTTTDTDWRTTKLSRAERNERNQTLKQKNHEVVDSHFGFIGPRRSAAT